MKTCFMIGEAAGERTGPEAHTSRLMYATELYK